ncbi:MAG: phage tail terminator protein [Bermanella sp.]|jgi:Phage minor tail protein U.
MEINNLIREAVIADLKAVMGDGFTYINGVPANIAAADGDDPGDLPAVAVYLVEGEATDNEFDSEEWSAVLHVEIFMLAVNGVDAELDVPGEQVRQVLERHYRAQGLLTACSRGSFTYGRDEVQPWGTLDLTFAIDWETD